MGLLSGPMGLGRTAIQTIGLNPEESLIELERAAPRTPLWNLQPGTILPPHSTSRQVIHAAEESAFSLGHSWVGTEHLLLGLIQRPDYPAATVFVDSGVTQARVIDWITMNMRAIESERTAD